MRQALIMVVAAVGAGSMGCQTPGPQYLPNQRRYKGDIVVPRGTLSIEISGKELTGPVLPGRFHLRSVVVRFPDGNILKMFTHEALPTDYAAFVVKDGKRRDVSFEPVGNSSNVQKQRTNGHAQLYRGHVPTTQGTIPIFLRCRNSAETSCSLTGLVVHLLTDHTIEIMVSGKDTPDTWPAVLVEDGRVRKFGFEPMDEGNARD